MVDPGKIERSRIMERKINTSSNKRSHDRCFEDARKIVMDTPGLLNNIMNSMGDGLSIQDRNMRIVYQNRFMVDHFGSHIGDCCYQIYERRNGTCDGCPIVAAFRTGEVTKALRVGITGEGTPFRFENIASPLRNDRGEIVAGMELCRIVEDREKAFDDLRATMEELEQTQAQLVRDISERKRAEIELRKSEARLRDVIDSTSDWIWEVDARGIYTFCSGRIHQVLGYDPEEVLGCTPFDLMPPEERGRVGELFAGIAAKKAPIVNIENWNLAKDGRRVCLLTNGVPIIDSEGRLTGYRGADQDITDRKLQDERLKRKNEDLARSNEELDEFAYIVSHDLKEPLRSIHSFSSFVLEDYWERLEVEGQSHLNIVMQSARRMGNLLDDLLTYSRVGQGELAMKPVDPAGIVAGVLEDMRTLLDEQNARVTVAGDLPTVICDQARVGEVFRNLIQNAVKYNESKEKQVEVGRLPQGSSEENGPVFFVRDNGIGIREKHLETVFRIFKRLHGRDKYGGGTGSGLTIARKIIERHGGRIWAESEFGKGSTFCFTLGSGA